MKDRVDLTKCWHRERHWKIWWYTYSAVFQQRLKTNLGFATHFMIFTIQTKDSNGLKSLFPKRRYGEKQVKCYPLINDRTWFPGSVALIFVPVKRRSVAAEPQHHKPILNYSPHKAARRVEHYNWIPSPTLFLSLWWYPPKSNSMTSSCPSLSLGLLSSGKQGHQQIPSLSFLNAFSEFIYYVIRKVITL